VELAEGGRGGGKEGGGTRDSFPSFENRESLCPICFHFYKSRKEAMDEQEHHD